MRKLPPLAIIYLSCVALLALAVMLTGCAGQFTAKTKIDVVRNLSTGADHYQFESDKNYSIHYDPATGKLDITAITPESAISAALQSQQRLNEKMDALLGVLIKSAIGATVP